MQTTRYTAVQGNLEDSSPEAMGRGSQGVSRKLLVVLVIGVVIIVSLLVAVIVLAAIEKNKQESDSEKPSPAERKQFDLLSHFRQSDGLAVKWFPGLKNEADLTLARSGNYHVLDIKVVPGSSAPVIEGGTMTLSQFLDMIRDDDFAVNIYVSDESNVQKAIDELQRAKFNKPVMISVPVLLGDNHFNLTRFLQLIKDSDTALTVGVNFDLTSMCCGEAIGIGVMEYIAELIETRDLSVMVEVDGAVLAESWSNLRWLLDKVDNLKLVMSANDVWDTTVNYHLLLPRNDADKTRIFFNLLKDCYDEFVDLASTAGSPLAYFDIHPRDAGKVIWSHNTDTWDLINKATTGDTMMVEGDIRLDPSTNIPIMAHDLGDNNNLTFSQWLEEIIKVDKGMKLDCKELQAVKPALDIVKSRRNAIKGSIWANADILVGPGDKPTKIPAADFLNAVKTFPGVTLSVGWTTVRKPANSTLHYTMDHVRQMHDGCKDLLQPVTFPIRAEQSLDSWESFEWLLGQSRLYTLTVWTAYGDDVTKSDMNAFKQKFEMSQVYFDLPKELRPDFA